MKKIYFLVAALFIGFVANAQFEDGLEDYSEGPLFTPRWTTWDGTNDGAQNITVTSERALEGSNSAVINSAGQDAVLDFQANATSGTWSADFRMFIPSGKSGYFNIQGNVTPNANDNAQFMSGDIYFNEANGSPGQGTDANANGEGTFSFPHDEWFFVSIVVDMDAQTYNLSVAGNEVGDVAFNGTSDSFAGLDFFFAEPENEFFIDNVRFSSGLLSAEEFSTDVFSVYPNPVVNTLHIKSATSVENIAVYNILGKQVLVAQPNAISPSVDMSRLPSGVYLVNVTINGASKTIKVLK